MAHTVGAVVGARQQHEGGVSLGDSAAQVLLQRRVGLGSAAERPLDGRDGRLRLLPLVREPEQLRVRVAAPEAEPVAARGAGAAAWQAWTSSGPRQCAWARECHGTMA